MPADDRAGAGPAPAATARVPRATYRLQFNRDFTFDDAAALVPYLAALGISDLYASSYLAARPGSAHGYDIVDHASLNPEIGSTESYQRMTGALRAHDMGHILDVVPNHMSIAEGANRWWNDVLENGQSSAYAEFFDIEWQPVEHYLVGRVLLPILGEQYGRVLENQELVLEEELGAFRVRYYGTRLPVEPRSSGMILSHGLPLLTESLGDDNPDVLEYQSLITALANLPPTTETAPERTRERMREKEVARRRLAQLLEASPAVRSALEETLRAFNGKRGDPRSFDLFDRLLSEQPYRLAHWRVAGEEINYRRFFDINELAALRTEVPAVFRETHRLVLDLIAAGHVTGVRIDHPDGLLDPRQYFLSLQRERFAQLAPPEDGDARQRRVAAFDARCTEDPRQPDCRPLYIAAEKILGRGERLPSRWAVHGTTGYEFLALVSGLFVDPVSARAMAATYVGFTGQREPFADVVYESKKLIMDVSMSSELSVLGHALRRLAERDRSSRDFPRKSLTDALREVIACFPLYRTYIESGTAEVELQDRACIEVAVAFAKRRNPATSVSIFDFVRDVLLLRAPEMADGAYRAEQRAFVLKFQQVTSPITAKGVEDTAFYRYNRLVSLNEVGGDPEQYGTPVADFHAQCAARRDAWPSAMSATATHDTKRGEDVRARVHVLSEVPRPWRDAVRRWHRMNRRQASSIDGEPAPSLNDEYLLYQTLFGAWPTEPLTDDLRRELTQRIQAYMAKASKEAKVNTSWVSPNQAYDEALGRFIERVLDPAVSGRFLADFSAFQEPLSRLGMVNGLAQALIKVTAPGLPDFYQGTELWDLSLVDPDNRRPVDFARRRAALEEISARAGDARSLARELLEHWRDGRVKLYLVHRALLARRARGAVFTEGEYRPLGITGRHAEHVCAFGRVAGGEAVITVVPRLTARLTGHGAGLAIGAQVWADTAIALPSDLGDHAFVDAFTGVEQRPAAGETGAMLRVADVLAEFPVALLERPR